ncbi:hypothetical protein Ahy_A09g046094 [Arachis hypogaea]|uniref:Ubiquitin-like protease family profile domain-containing protein n=1 Tax=Arachis hypogaea TaxID=3818 RepID=A0A445BNU4_ARAHY|nr:hypothetical protein Ahy_A09g046094 [Arachis hypogaea]
MLSREEESVSDPAQQQMIVFQPPSKPLNIIPIQLFLPSSQPTSASHVPPFEPSPQIESDPAPEATAAALLMMARTASYVPREFLLPSFSLDFTDSSQEETQTQEGEGQPESQIVTTMCLILNQENIKRFQEEIYCLPLNIVIFAPICYSEYWWIWVADVRKKKIYILDPYHNECPSKARMNLNKFVPQNVIKEKYEWDNWTRAEVDHFRVEFAS